jgi:hypothetical protein
MLILFIEGVFLVLDNIKIIVDHGLDYLMGYPILIDRFIVDMSGKAMKANVSLGILVDISG